MTSACPGPTVILTNSDGQGGAKIKTLFRPGGAYNIPEPGEFVLGPSGYPNCSIERGICSACAAVGKTELQWCVKTGYRCGEEVSMCARCMDELRRMLRVFRMTGGEPLGDENELYDPTPHPFDRWVPIPGEPCSACGATVVGDGVPAMEFKAREEDFDDITYREAQNGVWRCRKCGDEGEGDVCIDEESVADRIADWVEVKWNSC